MKYRAKVYSGDKIIKYLLDVKASDFFDQPKDVSIEGAFIDIPDRAQGKPRYALCLSAQVGCIFSCMMCKNMFDGFYRNLTSKELNKQIDIILQHDGNLEKIVAEGAVEYAFMAVGEPLYAGTLATAIKEHKKKVEDTKFALSSIGLPGTIRRFSKNDFPYPVRLELSLHFSNDSLRNQWMVKDPYVKQLPTLNIHSMLDEAQEFMERHPGKVTINHMLIDGINNMDKNLDELTNLLKGKKGFYVKVMWPNLSSAMVFSWKGHSPGCPKGTKTYSPPEFKEKLIEKGIEATCFESGGGDVGAGCGMLRLRSGAGKGILSPDLFKIPQADPKKLGFG